MAPLLSPRRVHTSELVRVTDTLCASGAHTSWGEAEAVDAAQVILVRRGAFAVRGPRGRVLGDAASALLMNADEPYEVRHPVDGGDHCTALAYDDAIIEDVLSAEGTSDDVAPRGSVAGLFARPQRRVSIQATLAHARLLRALQVREATSDDTLRVDELALALLGALVRGDSPGTGGMVARRARTEQRWADAVDALRAHLAADPACNDSLPALARRVHTSPYHLARVFRAQTGMSIHDYRTRLRITAALQHLNNEADLTTIALTLGFASHSHFTTRFAQLTGLSPSGYRGEIGEWVNG